MRILVTRPEPDAAALARTLVALGHETITDPLLEPALLPPAATDLAGAGALAVTSRNALRALAASAALPAAVALPVYVVGPATAEHARAVGFGDVREGRGTAADLVPLIASSQAGAPDPVVYLAGETLAFDLAATLAAAGCPVRQVTVYRTVAAKSLRAETLAAIAGGRIDAVLLMSPRTAAVYVDLVRDAGLSPAVQRLPHLCLSPRVAQALAGLDLADVTTAVHPTTEDLLALVAARRHTPTRAG
jgi:uroporphyrinogen-III synthase